MKEKILKLIKSHKMLILLGLVLAGVITAIVVTVLQPHEEEQKVASKEEASDDRGVRGPKTAILYYNNFENEKRMISDGATIETAGTNVIELISEEDNKYVKFSVNEKENCYMQAACQGVDLDDTLIIEMNLSTEGNTPYGKLEYPYDRATTNPNPKQSFFYIQHDGRITVNTNFVEEAEVTIATLEPGKWTRIGIKFTPGDGKYIMYVYNEETGSWEQKVTNNLEPSAISPNYMRLFLSKDASNIGTSLLLDDFAAYVALNFTDISDYEVPDPITVTTTDDVEMDHPELTDIGEDGIAVMEGKDFAYVGTEKISLSTKAVEEKITTGEESGFKAWITSIINFFKRLFGMEVKEVVSVTTYDVKVPGDFIEKYLGVEVEKSSELYSLGELAEEAGRNVVYDSRGVLVVTDKETKLDAEDDVKLLTLIYGLFESGEEVSNYAAAPVFTQSIIDEAINTYAAPWRNSMANDNAAEKSANALYYLTLISNFYPEAKHSVRDITVVEAALVKLRVYLNEGGEPFASPGCFWGHAVIASSMTLIKETDVIYSQLTEDEKVRMDIIMEAMAIAANWGYNDGNDYTTSFDLQGNFADGANFRNTYLSVMLNASMYFGEEKLNEIFVNFDYLTFIEKLKQYGFNNIYMRWTDAGIDTVKELMEKGGDAYLIGFQENYYSSMVGKQAGTGVGVKEPFSYDGHSASDIIYLFSEPLIAYTYPWQVISQWGTPDTATHCYILSDNKVSPFEGQMGMMQELAKTDSGDVRSKIAYCYDSWEILTSVYANMKLLGGWDSSTQRMRELDNRIWVGNEDLLYKMQEGYQGRSISVSYEEYEYSFNIRGHKFVKDIWNNFHCMLHTETTTTTDPDSIPITKIPYAEPMEGDGRTVPEGAFEAGLRKTDGTFPKESFHRILEEKGKGYVSGKLEFEIVIPDGVDESNYNCVVMLGEERSGLKWANMNMLIQFYGGYINIYNGSASVSDYIETGIRFGANYRYKVELDFDVLSTKYTTKITQVWPKTDKEISFTAKDYKFRATGDSIAGVNSLVIVKNDLSSPMWIEDFKVIREGYKVDVAEPEWDMERIPGSYYQNDFNSETRKLTHNASTQTRNKLHTLEQMWDVTDSGNGWASLTMGGSDSGWFAPRIGSKRADTPLVVEMKISTSGTIPDIDFYYDYKSSADAEKVSWTKMFDINNGVIECNGIKIATITPDQWTKIGIIFTPSTGEYTVYEYNQARGVYERRVESNTVDSVVAPTFLRIFAIKDQPKGSNIYLDDICVYSGTEFYFNEKDDSTGVMDPSAEGKNEIKTPAGYYYWSDYNVESCKVKYDAAVKSSGGYNFNQGRDADGNGYLNIASKSASTTSSFFRAQVEGATNGDYIITELSMRMGSGEAPNVGLMYDYNNVNGSSKVKTLFNVKGNSGKVIGADTGITSLKKDGWTRIGVILNQTTGEYAIYEFDAATNLYVWKAKGTTGVATQTGYPTFVGLNIEARESLNVSKSLHVDDFYIYGSNSATFKGVSTGAEPPFDGIYYNQNYEDVDLWNVGHKTKYNGGVEYKRLVEANGNAYMNLTSRKDSTVDDFLRVSLEQSDEIATRSVVVEMDMRANAQSTPTFQFMFDTGKNAKGSTTTKNVFSLTAGSEYVIGSSSLLATLSEGWSRVGMILSLDTGEYTLYAYNEKTKTYEWKEAGTSTLTDGYPTYIGFYFPSAKGSESCSIDLDNFKVYSGTAFANVTTGTKPPFDGKYYSQDYEIPELYLMDAAKKGNNNGYNYEHAEDKDGNGYLKISSKSDANLTGFFRADVTGASDAESVVLEMKLRAGKSTLPKVQLQYDRINASGKKTVGTIFTINDSENVITQNDKEIASVTNADWTQIGAILNIKTGEFTIYRYVEGQYVAMETGKALPGAEMPTYFGLYIAEPGDGSSREIHVDDFKVYEGETFSATGIADGSNKGSVVVHTQNDEGIPEVTVNGETSEVLETVLTTDEQLANYVGENVSINLKSTVVANESPDRAVISNALNGRNLGVEFVLNLSKQIGDANAQQVTSIDKPVNVSIDVPESLINTNPNWARVYEIICVNEGEAKTIEVTFNEETKEITLDVDKFGTYAIVYNDVDESINYDFEDDVKHVDSTSTSTTSIITEADGNKALKIVGTNNKATTTIFNAVKSVTSGIVCVEVDIKASGTLPQYAHFMGSKLGGTNTALAYSIYSGSIKGLYNGSSNGTAVEGEKWGTISDKEWRTLAFKIDVTNKTYKAYYQDKICAEGTYTDDAFQTFSIRFNGHSKDASRTLLIDNLKIYREAN